MLRIFKIGAEAVLVATYHFEDCHYMFGAGWAAENYRHLEQVVSMLGIEKKRVRLEWISAAELSKFVRVIREITAQVKKFGPSPIRRHMKVSVIESELISQEI